MLFFIIPHVHEHVFVYACMYLGMYVCMYVCTYVLLTAWHLNSAGDEEHQRLVQKAWV